MAGKGPIDYDRLCNQTVTVYRKTEEAGTSKIQREVHKKAFLDFKKTLSVDKLGATEATSFLLIIPGNTQAVFTGDKVLLGEGPEEIRLDAWAKEFIPVKVSGLFGTPYHLLMMLV